MQKLFILVCIALLGFSCITCSDSDKTNEIHPEKKYPLVAFEVMVGKSHYHAKIDQSANRVEISDITDPNTITGVDYTLMSDGAAISPDPATFIGRWKKEQTVTVTTEDHVQTTYTIVFTKFAEPVEKILFWDDFNGNGPPDPDKWILCKKAGSDWNDEMSESYDQAYVKDGKLVLVAEKVNGAYKAGGIATNGKFDFTFGKVEVRARITRHPDGAFPAIWMMPRRFIYNNWPNCGEIDIMEHIKQQPYIHQTVHTHYTYHLGIKNPANTSAFTCNCQEWNTYAVTWTEDHLTFFVNGQETFSYPNLKLGNEAEMQQWPFTGDASFYLILNMGLGGKPDSWAGPVDDHNLPAVMEIDWVKVTGYDHTPPGDTRKAVIGYLPLNDGEFGKLFPSLEWNHLTHVNACFARVRSDGSLDIESVQKNIKEVRQAARKNNVKMLISIAKEENGSFAAAVNDPQARKKLTDRVIAFTRENELDGFDIDYEDYDDWDTNFPALLAFVRELYDAKDEGMLMTCAVNCRWRNYGTEWEQYFDYMNLMSYGRNAFTDTPVQHASYDDFVKDLKYWNEQSRAPKSKLIGGLPFYGFSWDERLKNVVDDRRRIRYSAILQYLGREAADKNQMDNTYYNGRPAIAEKCRYVKENNYGGVMIWQLLQDAHDDNDDLKLIKVVGETLK
ncbi:MAG: DUF4971 domain-containing protein [Proteiniphilum sp.]|nr:DUF4971 domain-containing protein [Proteiniphilum sp.]